MAIDGAGAATARPPLSQEPNRRERWARRSAGVPFRVKVWAVWAFIFLALAFLFWAAQFDNAWIRENLWFIARGLLWTLLLALGGIVLAIVLALVGALGRLSTNPVAFGLSGFYTSFFRGTPLIVQLSLFYLAMPQVARKLSERFPDLFGPGFAHFFVWTAVQVGILVLGLNYGAYMTEIFRAGIQSVSHGQSEAADALGMSYRQKMRRVVLPQALRVVIPPTGNEFIAMMKDTALVSVLGQSIERMELFRRAQLLGNADVKYLESLISAAALYWLLTAIFSFFQARLERRLSRGYIRAGPSTRDRRKATDATGLGSPHAGPIDRPIVGAPSLEEPGPSGEGP